MVAGGKGRYGGARDPYQNTTRKLLGSTLKGKGALYIYKQTTQLTPRAVNCGSQKKTTVVNRSEATQLLTTGKQKENTDALTKNDQLLTQLILPYPATCLAQATIQSVQNVPVKTLSTGIYIDVYKCVCVYACMHIQRHVHVNA